MDVGNLEEKTITIFIKTPNQAHEDQTIHGVSLNWTVKDLKRHLSTVFPGRPVSFYGAGLLAALAEVASSCSLLAWARLCDGMLEWHDVKQHAANSWQP